MLVSRFSYPKQNILFVECETPSEGIVELDGYLGEFVPDTADLSKTKKVHICREKLSKTSTGLSKNLNISIPWIGVEVFGNMVHWNRSKDGKLYNGYHHMHIAQLKDLYKVDPDPIYLKYAKKWQDYTKQWKDFPLYQRSDFSYERFG